MKIAVTAEGPDLNARAGARIGGSPYLLVIDLASRHFKALPLAQVSGQGAGIQAVALMITEKCDFFVTEWCSPLAEKYLSAHGVGILTGVTGSVAEILDQFESEGPERGRKPEKGAQSPWRPDRREAVHAVRSASHQILNLLPVMISVVLLIGLLSAFASESFLKTVFSGSLWRDSLLGALAGSLFAGNAVNSYVIGAELLESGVSPVAVTAFMFTWVSVGAVQLPAEAAALGWRFALIRNGSCFGLSLAISLGVVFCLELFGA